MKKTFIAIVAVIIASASIFWACSKDSEETQNVNTEKSLVQNEANPYDFVGQLYNEALDYTFAKYGYGDISEEDIYTSTVEFISQKFPENTNANLSFDEIQTLILNTEDDVASLLLGEISANKFFQDEVLAETMNQLNELFLNMLTNNELFSPNEFAEQVRLLENRVLDLNGHNQPSISGQLNEYDIALISLAISRYSYNYWYSVATDINNPFHDYFLSNLGNGDKRCPLFKKIGEFFKKVGEAIVDVVVVTYTDIAAAFESIKLTFNDGSNNGGLRYPVFTISLSAAANASSSEAHRRKR